MQLAVEMQMSVEMQMGVEMQMSVEMQTIWSHKESGDANGSGNANECGDAGGRDESLWPGLHPWLGRAGLGRFHRSIQNSGNLKPASCENLEFFI